MKMIKTYYKNGDVATHRFLRGDFGLHNHPTMPAIGKIMNKFEETVVVTNIETPVHNRFSYFAKNSAIKSESACRKPECVDSP